MTNKLLNPKLFFSAMLLSMLAAGILLYASEGGRTGRTLKTSTAGCGSCHGSSATTDVVGQISGPDTVTAGQTVTYNLTIGRAGQTGAGLDVSVRQGTLGVVSSQTHVSGGELTHSNNITMSGGNVTIPFHYTAPSSAATDTIWATVIATNSSSSQSGDYWNWAPSKRVVVRLPAGITNISESSNFRLNQNFPNPFNPSTHISIDLSSRMNIRLTVLDALGNRIAVLSDGKLSEGHHDFVWNASGFSSGVYFYKVDGENFSVTRKMALLK